jgi:hypothetical protein
MKNAENRLEQRSGTEQRVTIVWSGSAIKMGKID